MGNRITEKFGTEIAQICGQAESILDMARAERHYTVIEYITLLSLAELVETLRMDLRQPHLHHRLDGLAGGGNLYQLPLMDTEEYILVRNLLENYRGTDGKKAGMCASVLDKVSRGTKYIVADAGSRETSPGSSPLPTKSVFRQYFDGSTMEVGK